MPFTHVFPPSHLSKLPKFYLFFKAKVKTFFIEVIASYLHPSVVFSSLSSFSTFSLYTQFNIKLRKYNTICNIL